MYKIILIICLVLISFNAYSSKAEEWFEMGNLATTEGRYKDAVDFFSKSIKAKPDKITYIMRGNANDYLQNFKLAISDYTKAINMDPDYFPTYINRGDTYRKLKEYKKAIKDFKKTLKLSPDNCIVYYKLAGLYSIKKDKKKAIKFFSKAIAKGYNYFDAIKKDPNIEFIRDSKEYKELMKGK